ncbi:MULTISPECIES: sucrose-specific PTS transporter subunit IIBC [Streptococcus]|jgi:PTS system sucrose-specific IIBC component|uniref:sucrose-specific PTS transporter subunit IIBC n=1 Tax=Streptococcus TaxID=1301 RepID=UPI00066C2BBA|nr:MULTISPECIES: sucrose-specific PTS transporter subunit IIBC [Streptococcus]MBU6827181.1 sucrose-specific PTS transporter subunit IIBC [Streptococcus oralis]MBU6873976.1 sucrose-specific PTS transporter subunit IIBC [Streptococcus oralis]MCB7106904.1 sucrose-specific PTS transporter subunit IIBC [Streptococcus oralis]MCQ5168812.1 sucrose-specific PTS transporter subunit IIBC [Streptococcus oralis]OFJ65277.1 PTS beta-glucoside transporter subunit EIIBCA [Streptococcus sp. HMSC077F03]
MNNQDIAKKVIEALGGRENVNSVAHCATRLRVMVKDEGKIKKEVIENLDKVQGAFFNSGQYQIIFGTGTVNKMYDEVVALGLPTSSKEDMKAEAAKQGNWFQRAIRTFGDVFVPIIPVIVATGLFMGLRGLLNALGITLPEDVTIYSQILTDTAFIILPGLVVWSTFRVFGGNPAVGIVLGMMLVSDSLPNAWAVASGGEVTAMQFFGFIPVVGLQGSVLPAFIIGVVGAKFEKAVRKVVPDVLDLLVTPFVTLLVMSILGLFVIGPVFHVVESYILIGTKAILNLPFGLGGFLIGGVHQLIVVSGVHHIFNLLEVQLLAADHANPFNAIITAAMTAQGAATVAVGVKTKNPKLKTLAFPAALSAFLGITEPAIFGVNLRFRKPFFLSLIAGAIGGGLASILGLAGTGNGITVIPGTMLYIGNGQLLQYLLMVAVSFVLGFALTYMFGYEDEVEEVSGAISEAETDRLTEEAVTGTVVSPSEGVIQTPIVGDVVALSNVNDPVFSSGAMGQGIAVKPSQDVVYAPADAEVTIVFPTGHAYGLRTANGAEILIHVGIDTVSMNGEGFNHKVAQGDKVKAGDVLGTFDSAKIAAAGLDNTTMVIVTNTADFASVNPVASGSVAKGDAIIEVKA